MSNGKHKKQKIQSRKGFRATNWVENNIGVVENKKRVGLAKLTDVGVRERGEPARIERDSTLTVTVWGEEVKGSLMAVTYTDTGKFLGYAYVSLEKELVGYGPSILRAATAFQRVVEGHVLAKCLQREYEHSQVLLVQDEDD